METKAIFEQMASRYDTSERVEIAHIIAGAMRDALAGSHAESALDYGCGTGLVGLQLVDMFETITLMDTSEQMVEQVRAKIEAANLPSATAVRGDFLDAVPQGMQFDCVLLSQVLLHVRNTSLMLARLYSALHDGGCLLVVDFDKNPNVSHERVHNGFVQTELIDQLKQAGFTSASARTFYHGQKMFMKQDASLFILTAQK